MNEPKPRPISDIDLDRVERITMHCKAALRYHHPMEQGAALAQLVALWVAGHNAEVRDLLLDLFFRNVVELAKIDAVALDRFRKTVEDAIEKARKST